MKLRVIRTIPELRNEILRFRRSSPVESTVGFVPTMGYLHAGHESLLVQSLANNNLTVLSIFVNPLQFGPGEDLDKYPRNEAGDIEIAAKAGVDIVFIPSLSEMYPVRMLTNISVAEVTDRLCGASRPGHFDGVATVVMKLLNIVLPDRAYFGLKDAQQIAVITRMVNDLNIPVEIVPCPTEREEDGLALSSRNVFLDAEQRSQALVLSRTLVQSESWILQGMNALELRGAISDEISKQSLADIDYVEIVNYPDLQPLNKQQPVRQIQTTDVLIALAVRFGKTRLIDNKIFYPLEVNAHVSPYDEG